MLLPRAGRSRRWLPLCDSRVQTAPPRVGVDERNLSPALSVEWGTLNNAHVTMNQPRKKKFYSRRLYNDLISFADWLEWSVQSLFIPLSHPFVTRTEISMKPGDGVGETVPAAVRRPLV